ncbi:hypothetical protein TUM3792_06970 [Shewanella sp. MBTL60-007]|nr:hypothetical protein TUM3792_06970 [Shewanella sp. MBTL60-007]
MSTNEQVQSAGIKINSQPKFFNVNLLLLNVLTPICNAPSLSESTNPLATEASLNPDLATVLSSGITIGSICIKTKDHWHQDI